METTPSNRIQPRVRASVFAAVVSSTQAFAEARQARSETFAVAMPEDPYEWMSLSAYLHFFEAAAATLREPMLGLKISSQFSPSELGPVGVLFTSAMTLADGIAQMSTFLRACQEDTDVSLKVGRRYATLSYAITTPALRNATRQDAEFSVGAMMGWMRLLLGRGWKPIEVHFVHHVLQDVDRYEAFFNAPVYFGVNQNALIFDAADATRALSSSEPVVTGFMRRHLRDLLEAPAIECVADQVRRLVAKMIGVETVTIPKVAERMHLSCRSLQRHLRQEQTSLRAILREERQHRGKAMVQSTGMCLSEMAQALGYSDCTTLNRAFKAWTGSPPRQFFNKLAEPGLEIDVQI